MNLEELEPYIVEFFADLGIMTDDELHDYLDTVLGVMEYDSYDAIIMAISDALDEESVEGESELLEGLKRLAEA
jgi:hypothetical protein